jgi:hypothetical protein
MLRHYTQFSLYYTAYTASRRLNSNSTTRSNVSRPAIPSTSRSLRWAPNFNPLPEEDLPMLSLTLFENDQTVCSKCKESFKADDILVSDTSSGASIGHIHLCCWDAKSSKCGFIQDAFKKRTRATRLNSLSLSLRSSNVPIAGWENLSCSRRLLFVHRLLAGFQSLNVNSKDIAQYFPCGNCESCNNPRFCSYASCAVPDIDPSICSSCNIKTSHRLCQMAHETSVGSLQSSVYCIDCHPSNKPQTRSRSSGNTRSFRSRPRSNQANAPIIYSSSPRKSLNQWFLLQLLCTSNQHFYSR